MATSPSAQPLSGDGRVGAAHPLDPLTAGEIARAAAIVRAAGELSDRAFFVSITLEEPAKDLILARRPAAEMEREAHVVVRDPASSTTHYGVVSLTHERVTTWKSSAAVQAALTKEELEAAAEVVKADARWLEAMGRRGVDPELTIVEPWVTGYFDAEDGAGSGRFVKPITFARPAEGANPYARPIEGISMRVDLDAMAVVEFEDNRKVPLPTATANFTADGLSDPANVPSFPDGVRRDIRALEVIQPDGPSFEVEGNEVCWQKWRFRIGFTYREGLVLHLLTYDDRGRERPILYRASTSEMFVPYGDVEDGQKWKGVFDIGDFGLGPFTNSLRLGCDCLGEIRYFDAVINDAAGEPIVIENAICLHEEDDGLLWKHFDSHSGEAEVRRARRLVISFIATIGNYDYAFYWHLHQDGSIGHEMRLTGVISAGAVVPGENPRCGTIVAPGVYGPNHQHFFSVRLDTMVDGLSNSVYECDSVPVPRSERNPHGGAWEVKHRRLERESDAQRLMSLERARYWRIVNERSHNQTGRPVGYRLVAGANALPLATEDCYAFGRGAFSRRHLWVTRYSADERYAGGDFPTQSETDEGLTRWSAGDRSIADEDVVVWYTIGAHHVVRPEDWPVMPVTRIGFHLVPDGFFDGNPALDVPPPEACAHDAHPHHHGAPEGDCE